METTALARHVRDELKRSGFRFPVTAPAAVCTGGSMTTVRVLKVHECDARDVARPPSQLGVKHPAGMLPWQTSVVPEHGWALLQEKLPESVPGAGATPGTMVRFSDV